MILGGGGFRVPLVYEATIDPSDTRLVDEVVLYDIDADRLAVIERVIASMAERPGAPAFRVTDDLDRALAGADFVFSAIRVGGAAGRTVDERVALGLGLLGQETIGPGGLAYALRTIGPMRRIAEAIARHAPDAWVINFTNPAGIVTEVMRTVLGDRVVGICDTPIGLVRRVARVLGHSLTDPDVDYDYLGLNHLGWLRSFSIDGQDRLPALLADDRLLLQIEEARILGPLWVRAQGVLPNEYLYYYLHTDSARDRILAAPRTRGEQLVAQQGEFYRAARGTGTPAADLWRDALAERESTYMAESRDEERDPADIAGGGYQEVALRFMAAVSGASGPERMILDVGNESAGSTLVPSLPGDLVVEVPCLVDAGGVNPRAVGAPDPSQLGLMAQLRGSERLIARAALTGSRDLAWQGFALHPLVTSIDLGRRLLEGYLAAEPGLAAILHR
ncbi:6-phospho-beta-glucosidase [Naumannella halotolerans]|uniref:6-phospho-beta-glucosidase n=1 Tax=Naumannella halotolerans TaxID=993414 RepID=A0A4R7J9D3_9ACTN|nr:6-phospho-beta-glucosidase [Naumannella halotolerans]